MSSSIVNFNSGLDEVQLYNVGGARVVKDSKLYKYKDDSNTQLDLDVELQPHVDRRLPGHQETRLNSSGCPGDNRKWQLEHRSTTSWVGGGESAGALLPHRAAAPASVTRYHEAAPL